MAKVPRSQPLQANDKPLCSRARKPREPSLPRLPFAPMPDRVEPCLARATSSQISPMAQSL